MLKGTKHSNGARKKMRKSAKGRIPWNKNKKGCQVAWNKGLKGLEFGCNFYIIRAKEKKKPICFTEK